MTRERATTIESSSHVARRFLRFTRQQWSALAKNTPLPLEEEDIQRLSSLGDPIDLVEADAIYRPLTALVEMYYTQVGYLHSTTSTFLSQQGGRTPFIIGIAGSVAVGKSTTARLLRELLSRWPATPRVDLVTTDGFLYPNAVLREKSLEARKGFPESYNRAALLDFLIRVKSGEENVRAPVYDHLTYDIVPDQWQYVHKPDILIIEGLNVLQPPPMHSGELLAVSDFFDLSIYVDAAEEDIRSWYLDRVLTLRKVAFAQKDSYFHQFASMPEAEMIDRTLGIWEAINHPNLVENIAPTRYRADIVICKGKNHHVDEVLVRKL